MRCNKHSIAAARVRGWNAKQSEAVPGLSALWEQVAFEWRPQALGGGLQVLRKSGKHGAAVALLVQDQGQAAFHVQEGRVKDCLL